MTALRRHLLLIFAAATAAAATITGAAFAAPALHTPPSVEASLTVGEYLGSGVLSRGQVWLLVSRYEALDTSVVTSGADGRAEVSRLGEGHRLQDAWSLVRLDLLGGERKTMLTDGVVDLKRDGRDVFVLHRNEQGAFAVSAFKRDVRTELPRLPIGAGDEAVGLLIDKGRPVVLTRAEIARLSRDGKRWTTMPLSEKLAAGPARFSAPLDGGSAVLAADNGLRRIDLSSGSTHALSMPAGACAPIAKGRCDNIRNLTPDPTARACVLAAIGAGGVAGAGAGADVRTHGEVIRICRDRTEVVWSHPAGLAGASSVVLGVSPASDGFWASTHLDGLYRIKGAEGRLVPIDHSRVLGGVALTCLPDAVVIAPRASSAGAALVLPDPDQACHDS